MAGNKDQERLYLSREDGQDIYIDVCRLPQHQIDGIRLLYRQFKKNKAGVILNDPIGYGKTLQVVLFLSAICPMLDKPILILCNEGDEQKWMYHFRKWTKLNDAVIETSNPFTKNFSVCINPMKNLSTFSHRDWSVVVIDSDGTIKEILRTDFKSNFRIWVTSENLKHYLHPFALIHDWLFPKEKFNMKEFEPNANKPKDVVSKAIKLDAFMEDIVIRRNDFLTPFEKYKSQRPTETMHVSPPKLTRKNKDATGTKIKRSKTNLNTNIEATNAIKAPENDSAQVKEENVQAVDHKQVGEEEKMDVETFIRDCKPIGPNAVTEYLAGDNIPQNSQHTRIISVDTLVHDNEKCVEDNSTYKNDMATSISASECNDENGQLNKDFVVNTNETDTGNSSSDLILHYDNTAMTQTNENQDTISDVNVTGIDYKMKQLEEITIKKFKGSFLDTLF